MREKQIEHRLAEAVRKRGGLCVKWVSPGLDGVPDRIVLLPGKHIAFIELKAPGKSRGRCRGSGSTNCEVLDFPCTSLMTRTR